MERAVPDFIPGRELCQGFFEEIARPILDSVFPALRYTAGLLGYGSDVLGYDDAVSRDHMWGPRFYLFLDAADMDVVPEIQQVFAHRLPYTYRGYSVNFSSPDPGDNGVRRPVYIDRGEVDPLIFYCTIGDYLESQISCADPDALNEAAWLALSEHRLLSLVSARLYQDMLGLGDVLDRMRFYPPAVKRYLIASCWDAVACEQAFAKRCADCGDELGARLITARIAERLMRLCFLYCDTYAPYSKWFGTAFARLPIDPALRAAICDAVTADSAAAREEALVQAQYLTARFHDACGITVPVQAEIGPYFGRDIRVIHAERIAEIVQATLCGTPLAHLPLMGSLSQLGGLSGVSDEVSELPRIRRFYEN